jgi:tetraacyldisaccharide 4'-kinase
LPIPSPSIEGAVVRAWRRRGLLAWLLLPLSAVFGALTALRRSLYQYGVLRSERLPVPVVVVGNLFVGGTGKTPFAIWLIDALMSAGFKPGVISRGYGGSAISPVDVKADSDPRTTGDEPVLIAARTKVPVVVAPQRLAAARHLLATYPDVDVLVSDDGLQHYALARDIEIVMFDSRGAGNGWLLPAGPLREPLSRARDFTVVNGGGADCGVADKAYRMILQGNMAERLCNPEEKISLAALSARQGKVVAAAGIGHPERFFAMLLGFGVQVEAMPLPDHYEFHAASFASVQAGMILITEKDAVKCRRIAALESDPRIWVVPVTAQVDDALAANIVEKLRGHPTA